MGRRDVITGADFSGVAIGFSAPVTRGLEYWNYFGGDATKTSRNMILGKPTPSVIGTPTVQSNHARFTHASAHVDTGVLETVAGTLIAVMRAPSLPNSQFAHGISTYNGSYYGAVLFMEAGTGTPLARIGTARDNATQNGTNQAWPVTIPNLTDWALYVGRFDHSLQTIYDKTRNTSNTGATTMARIMPAVPKSYRVGSAVSSVTGFVEMACAVIHSVVLTETEVNQQCAVIRARMTALGITV